MTREDALIQFPCSFPLKIMGLNNDVFEPAMRTVVETFVCAGRISYSQQLSSTGKYISITATFTAVSQEQLDALYRALHDHDLVVMTL